MAATKKIVQLQLQIFQLQLTFDRALIFFVLKKMNSET